MAKSSIAIANAELRDGIIKQIADFFQEKDEDVLKVASNALAFPTTNSNNDDAWIKITVSVPTGSRKDGEPFDGYGMADEYKQKQEADRIKKAEAEAKKQKKIEYDKKLRENLKKKK